MVTALVFSFTAKLLPPTNTGDWSLASSTRTTRLCWALNRPSPTCTVSSYTWSWSASKGCSWSGACRKRSTPVSASISNKAASAPPVSEKFKCCTGTSRSWAVTCSTVLVFSTTSTEAALVMLGACTLLGTTTTDRSWLSDHWPSEALTCTW